jgi:hypothetical protein
MRTQFAAVAMVAALGLAHSAFAQSAAEIAKAKDEVWAMEKKIYTYEQRNLGGDYYYRISADGYLGWVYGTPKPFHKPKAPPTPLTTPTKEVITPEFTDFSLEGNTAILYYTNHRTMLRDGTPVDQYFDNIHVFIREGGDWKLMASMSRIEDPKAK